MMQEDGVLAVVLPEAHRLDRLRRLIAIELGPDPLRRLAALIEVDGEGAVALAARLRFSNAWRDRMQDLSPPWPLDPQGDVQAQRRALYWLGVERYRDLALLLAAEGEVSRSRLVELLDLARAWTPPVFPLAGCDVTALGIPAGERGRTAARCCARLVGSQRLHTRPRRLPRLPERARNRQVVRLTCRIKRPIYRAEPGLFVAAPNVRRVGSVTAGSRTTERGRRFAGGA